MSQFNHTIDYLQLLELDLNGKLFTWTNEQDDPTMSRIDRFLATTEWHDIFPQADLQAIGTMTSDHCPLIMQGLSPLVFIGGLDLKLFGQK
jgi:exonuclease III